MRTLSKGKESVNDVNKSKNVSKIPKRKSSICTVQKDNSLIQTHVNSEKSSTGSLSMHNNDSKYSNISLTTNSTLCTTTTASKVTVIKKSAHNVKAKSAAVEELKLSVTSVVSEQYNHDADTKLNDKQQAFKRWLADKNRQKREERKKMETYEKALITEKEKKLEQERRSFAIWLRAKREQEKKQQKLMQEKKEQEMQLEKEKKEKRVKLVEMKFKLWLKRKEEESLKGKMHQQLDKMEVDEVKQKRIDDSVEAYNTWLKNSKYKPKPVPSNRGLDSLKTSVSVSYINPLPWVPNIEKPVTK